jgi:hypothetical protein
MRPALNTLRAPIGQHSDPDTAERLAAGVGFSRCVVASPVRTRRANIGRVKPVADIIALLAPNGLPASSRVLGADVRREDVFEGATAPKAIRRNNSGQCDQQKNVYSTQHLPPMSHAHTSIVACRLREQGGEARGMQ